MNIGSFEVEASPDCWPVDTKDGSLSAHFEHTVAITEREPDVLTTCRPGFASRSGKIGPSGVTFFFARSEGEHDRFGTERRSA